MPLVELQAALFWLFITVSVYAIATVIYHKSGTAPLLHPLLVSAAIIFLVLTLASTSVSHYQQSTQLLVWLLGPATVALALPLYRQVQVVRGLGFRVLIPILLGGTLAPLMAWLAMVLLSNDTALQMTMLVKSITTPLAVDVSEITQGIPALAAGIVITTGIVGAIVSSVVFKWLNIQSEVAQGVALGTVAHAIGTVKALQISDKTAALATLSLCVNGITTALIVPILF